MPCEFICDGCGKRAPAMFNKYGDAFKPPSWFSRADEKGPQLACSRECIAKISEKTGVTSVVLPF